MSHYCRICDRGRPNEKFTGRGHRDHICKDCQRLPRSEREQIEHMGELSGFLEQSNISAKNIARLEILSHNKDNEVKRLAALVLDIARVKPHKRRRWKFLAQNHPVLFARLKELYGGDIPYDVLESLNLEEDDSDLSDDLLDYINSELDLSSEKPDSPFLIDD
jgi:hypothetical protein